MVWFLARPDRIGPHICGRDGRSPGALPSEAWRTHWRYCRTCEIGGRHFVGVSTIWTDCAAIWPRHVAASVDFLGRVGVYALAVPSAQDDCPRDDKRSS